MYFITLSKFFEGRSLRDALSIISSFVLISLTMGASLIGSAQWKEQ